MMTGAPVVVTEVVYGLTGGSVKGRDARRPTLNYARRTGWLIGIART